MTDPNALPVRTSNRNLHIHGFGDRMTTRHKHTISLAAALACLFVGIGAGAQPVDTRMGKLQLENGYPSQAALKTLYDEMDFQRATQAYLWGLPAVGFHGLHLAHLNTFGAKDGDIVLYQTLKDKTGMLTPNLTTLYAMSFWNMAEKGTTGRRRAGRRNRRRRARRLAAAGHRHGPDWPRQRQGRQVPDPAPGQQGRAGPGVHCCTLAHQSIVVRNTRPRAGPGGSRSYGAQAPALCLG
jgi:hypothetical protein